MLACWSPSIYDCFQTLFLCWRYAFGIFDWRKVLFSCLLNAGSFNERLCYFMYFCLYIKTVKDKKENWFFVPGSISKSVYLHVCQSLSVYLYIYLCVCIYKCVSTWLSVSLSIAVYVHVCICIFIYICVSTCIMFVCICIFIMSPNPHWAFTR